MEDDELKERFDGVDTRFEEIDVRFDNVDARLERVDARFEKVDAQFERVDAQFSEMRQLIVYEGERTRNHFDVVAEGLEDRIKLGFEGYTALRSLRKLTCTSSCVYAHPRKR